MLYSRLVFVLSFSLLSSARAMEQEQKKALCLAAGKNDVPELKMIIPTMAKAMSCESFTTALNESLFWAACNDAGQSTDFLCAAGADLDARIAPGETPLHTAAHHGCPKAVAALLHYNADPFAKDVGGYMPSDLAGATCAGASGGRMSFRTIFATMNQDKTTLRPRAIACLHLLMQAEKNEILADVRTLFVEETL